MKEYQVALAVNIKDAENMVFEVFPDGQDIKSTLDEEYVVYRWDWTYFPFDTSMLTDIRHALVYISDEGEFTEEIIEEDSRGCDEEFFDIINWNMEFTSWGDGIGENTKDDLQRKLMVAMSFLTDEQKEAVRES